MNPHNLIISEKTTCIGAFDGCGPRFRPRLNDMHHVVFVGEDQMLSRLERGIVRGTLSKTPWRMARRISVARGWSSGSSTIQSPCAGFASDHLPESMLFQTLDARRNALEHTLK